MGRKIVLNNIIKKNKMVEYDYQVIGDISKYFNMNEKYFIEYPFDVTEIPDSILSVPFLGNLLPIVWITDSELYLKELDEDFYNCIKEVEEGYINMYPELSFNGKIICDKVSSRLVDSKNVGSFFSGGVDAFSTLLSHIDEKPELITLWGADIDVNNINGWEPINDIVVSTANLYNLNSNNIKTSFRRVINETELTNLVAITHEGWWHGFQHGMGLITQAAPIAYEKELTTIYIASSHTAKDNVVCASHPTIDNKIKFCSCGIIHDQYDYTRQDKVKLIATYSEKTGIFPKLHVCWITTGGKNCCVCEKCIRTIVALLIENGDPNKYGFNNYDMNLIKKRLKSTIVITPSLKPLWEDIILRYKENHDTYKLNMDWLLTMDMEHQYWKRIKVFSKRVIRKLKKIFGVGYDRTK